MELSNVISHPLTKNIFLYPEKNYHKLRESGNKSISTTSVSYYFHCKMCITQSKINGFWHTSFILYLINFNLIQVVFEPKEISARSSELSKSPEQSETLTTQSFSGISYDSNLDAIKAQFNDEEFFSASKISDKLLADEMSWKRDNFAIPDENKGNLEFSCFSTAVVGSDIIENGKRISVGEFFQKKCGHLGHLSTTSLSDRPSFGNEIKSPNRRGRLRPLVNESLATEGILNFFVFPIKNLTKYF